jgi:hypothetical protein
MAFSTHQQATQEITLPVLRTHFCDANDAENDLNKCFSNILEQMTDSLTLENMEEFLRLFQNYFYETIDVGRGTDRGIGPDILSPQITVRNVLTRVPRQPWPLPVPHRGPNPLCSEDMETAGCREGLPSPAIHGWFAFLSSLKSFFPSFAGPTFYPGLEPCQSPALRELTNQFCRTDDESIASLSAPGSVSRAV